MHREDDLAPDEQLGRFALAEPADHAHRGDDGDEARDHAPQPRRDADVEEAFHHDLAGERAGERGVLAAREQREREDDARDAHAQHGAEKPVGILDFRHVLMAAEVKRGGGEHEDAAIDEKREHQRERRIERREHDRLGLALRRAGEVARLHDRAVQVEIVRHHRRADDADRNEEHLLVAEKLRGRDEAERDAAEARPGENQLRGEASADRENEHGHERFDIAEAFVLQKEHDHHIEHGDDAAPHQRDAEEKLERDGRADDFREVASGDRSFAEHPEADDGRLRIVIAAGLREVASGGDAQLHAKVLEQDRHQV